MNSGAQLLFLVFFSILGYLFGGILSGLVVVLLDGNKVFMDVSSYSLASLRLSQVISTVCWLLLSSILYLYLFQENGRKFLKIRNVSSGWIILLTILLVFAVQPLVGFLGAINHSVNFPESLASVEQAFKNMEEMASSMVAQMLADKSISGILINLFIIAVLAAVIEEIFFRGCLQQIILKIVKNKHVAIWITAIIFSIIHMQFYGFLPRVLLGALLGYLFVWTSNLWVPIIAHFVNNFTAVVLQIAYYGTPQYERIENFDLNEDMWILPLGILFSAIIIYFIIKQTKAKDVISLEI
ncbi:CPBP family intramembrane glutamic endopeptidase [Dysgonomonas massiliensis]|uniref:CPBP family intramembrane glutamic endopeptidase n=1 Tax=Dysgonomonas massiliensis TaxID=2040292 RepID=UPI0013592A7F|nr:CPBP family intramembrane glutamic endopeptidase [Dysgonomonas massiliensis]